MEGGNGRLSRDVNIKHRRVVAADLVQTPFCQVDMWQECITVACASSEETGWGCLLRVTASQAAVAKGRGWERGPVVRLWVGRRRDQGVLLGNRRNCNKERR